MAELSPMQRLDVSIPPCGAPHLQVQADDLVAGAHAGSTLNLDSEQLSMCPVQAFRLLLRTELAENKWKPLNALSSSLKYMTHDNALLHLQ